MSKIHNLVLPIILIGYGLLYMATSVDQRCFDDCEKINDLNRALMQNRESYYFGGGRCSYNSISDTLCVFVKDTSGIDWNLFADTVCLLANQKGLLKQKIFVLKNAPNLISYDTLIRKQCP